MPAALSPASHNHVLSATGTGVARLSGTLVSGPTIDSSFPSANALDPDPSLVTRIDFEDGGTAAVIAFYARLSASSNKACRLIAALNCRIPATVTSVQLALTDNAGTTTLATSRTFDPADLVPLQGTTDRYNLIDILSAEVNAARLEIRWTVGSSGAGNLEVGYLWAAQALVFDSPNGLSGDWSIAQVDPSDVVRSIGGALIATDTRKRRRILSASATAMLRDFAIGDPANPTELCLRSVRENCGLSAPLIFIVRSDAMLEIQTLAIYGAFTRFDEIKQLGANYYASRWTVEEIR